MNKTKARELLERFVEIHKAQQEELKKQQELFGQCVVEGSVWKAQSALTELFIDFVAATLEPDSLVDDGRIDDGWLGWYVYENNLGDRAMPVTFLSGPRKGQEIKIKSIEDLLKCYSIYDEVQ